MKALAIADLHGYLPEIESCDLLIIAGDVCPDFPEGVGKRPDRGEIKQGHWLDTEFRAWLEEIPAETVLGIAGNHDFVFERTQFLIPRGLRWTYLRDQTAEHYGLKFYGIPWVPDLVNWAFYMPDNRLQMAYDAVPDDTDVVISHGPPLGYCDFTVPRFGSRNAGSETCNQMLKRVKPQALICGHIHEGRGHAVHYTGTSIYNVACYDENYQETRPPAIIPL